MTELDHLTPADQSLTLETCLTERQATAAYLLGRCIARKQIEMQVEIKPKTLWRWLQIPEFQDAVRQSNREWLAELSERKARIIERALELEEQNLGADADAKRRADYAHEIARNVLK